MEVHPSWRRPLLLLRLMVWHPIFSAGLKFYGKVSGKMSFNASDFNLLIM